MSLKYNMKFYANQVETRLNDSMHVLSGKSKSNIRDEAQAIAKDFKELGYKINTKFQSPTQITAQDFKNIAAHWKEKGYAIGTQQDKASALRHILSVCGNVSANVNNKELGIENAGRDVLNIKNENRGCKPLSKIILNSVKDNSVRAAIKLIISYGLRRDEALHAVWAISKGRNIGEGGVLALQGSWTKNGRARSFKMADGGLALKEATELVRNFEIKGRVEQFRGRIDREFNEHHLKKVSGDPALHPHALRHNYSQNRYLSITSLAAPSAGGINFKDMTKEQKSLYHNACSTIALEMGHTRPEISKTYIGR